MSDHHRFSPSSLGSMIPGRCQGRSREEAKYPYIESESSAAGTTAHASIARELKWLSTHGLPQIAGIECKLPVKSVDGSVLTEGTADLVLWDGNSDTCDVVDWKYWNQPLDEQSARIQITCYCVGAMQSLKLRRARGWLYLPLLDLEYRAEVELGAGLRELESIVLGALQPDAPLVPGDWCRWCHARMGCPALAEKAKELALAIRASPAQIIADNGKQPTKKLLKERYEGQLQAMALAGDFDRIAKIGELMHAVEPMAEVVRPVIKALVQSGHAAQFPAWEVKERSFRAKANPLEVWGRVMDCLSDEEFSDACSVSLEKIEGHLLRRFEMDGSTKKEAQARVAELLGPLTHWFTRDELWRKKT